MTFQHKDNSGSLFKNDRREKETHPHAKGSAMVDGVEYWVSAWTNTKDDGTKWQAMKFQPKEEQKPAEPQQDDGDFDDDIPF